jgi:hypothetical protein
MSISSVESSSSFLLPHVVKPCSISSWRTYWTALLAGGRNHKLQIRNKLPWKSRNEKGIGIGLYI